jgi:hypothetical protein
MGWCPFLCLSLVYVAVMQGAAERACRCENCECKQLTIEVGGRFFLSPDGSEVWNIYHATTSRTGACDGNRYTAAKKVNWNEDGTPDFGKADAVGTVLAGPSGE